MVIFEECACCFYFALCVWYGARVFRYCIENWHIKICNFLIQIGMVRFCSIGNKKLICRLEFFVQFASIHNRRSTLIGLGFIHCVEKRSGI